MQKELAIFRQESGTGDTRELLSDIARLESQNATLKNELKELENKNFQENKQKEKDHQKLDKIEKDMLKYKRDVRQLALRKVFYKFFLLIKYNSLIDVKKRIKNWQDKFKHIEMKNIRVLAMNKAFFVKKSIKKTKSLLS